MLLQTAIIATMKNTRDTEKQQMENKKEYKIKVYKCIYQVYIILYFICILLSVSYLQKVSVEKLNHSSKVTLFIYTFCV